MKKLIPKGCSQNKRSKLIAANRAHIQNRCFFFNVIFFLFHYDANNNIYFVFVYQISQLHRNSYFYIVKSRSKTINSGFCGYLMTKFQVYLYQQTSKTKKPGVFMKKVAIVTDSTTYLPQDLIDDLGVHVVPLTLHWEDESFRDGVDIRAEEFYERLSTADSIPTTSQTPVDVFDQLFKKLLDEDYAVFALLISSGISGTVESALQAQANFPDAPVEVMDTQLVAMALGFLVLTVARAAKDGASLEQCVALAKETYPKIGVYFTVDTLKYLNKGGRINTAKRLLGAALDIKPIMEIRGGKIELVESVRSRKKSLQRMLELVRRDISGREPVRISTFHAAAEEDCRLLMEEAVARFYPIETITTFVSPVIGAHTGPGTVSIAYMAG
jgi:DegV family protein with EDD domain